MFEDLRSVIHEELKEQAEVFNKNRSATTLYNLYTLMKVNKMLVDIEPFHEKEELAEDEAPRFTWGN